MVNISNNYRKSFVQVEAVINCLNRDDYNKIPINVINAIKENKDESYIYEYNQSLEYSSWDLMPEAKAILYNLYKKYLATEEQREYLKQKEKTELYKIQEDKKREYNVENLFKTKEKDDNIENDINKSLEIVVYKESIFKKIWTKIKALFKSDNIF